MISDTDVTPTEARAVWDSLGAGASDRKVARYFEAAARAVSLYLIRKWRLNGWQGGETPAEVTVRLLRAAAPLLGGDRLAELVEAAKVVSEPPNPLAPALSEAERIKNSARKFIDCLTTFSDELAANAKDIVKNDLASLGPALSGLSRMQLAAAVGYNQAIAIAERAMKLQDDARGVSASTSTKESPPTQPRQEVIDHVPQLFLPAPRHEDDPLALEIKAWESGARAP